MELNEVVKKSRRGEINKPGALKLGLVARLTIEYVRRYQEVNAHAQLHKIV